MSEAKTVWRENRAELLPLVIEGQLASAYSLPRYTFRPVVPGEMVPQPNPLLKFTYYAHKMVYGGVCGLCIYCGGELVETLEYVPGEGP